MNQHEQTTGANSGSVGKGVSRSLRTYLSMLCLSAVLSLTLPALPYSGSEGWTFNTAGATSADHPLPTGFTADGIPYRGALDAPVVIEEYSDYLCPFCAKHFRETLPALVRKYGAAGKVRFEFHDFPIATLHPTAATGHLAALCVAQQSAPLFWAMHDELFRRQQEWRQQSDPKPLLAKMAADIGANTKTYAACIRSNRMRNELDKRVQQGNRLQFSGTPSFRFVRVGQGQSTTFTLVGAQPEATFVQWLDALLDGKNPPEPPKPELPRWLQPQALDTDPKHPGFTLAGSPTKGSPTAKVTVIEFSDFQCPPCRRHALETQPVIDEKFVNPGHVRWVFKNRPLREHGQALAAATAAYCAGRQAQFWDMHHALFENMDAWSVADPDPVLAKLALSMAIDSAEFNQCLQRRQSLEPVLMDIYDAEVVASTTPTFVILGSNGRPGVQRGFKSAADFTATLQRILEDGKTEAGRTATREPSSQPRTGGDFKSQ